MRALHLAMGIALASGAAAPVQAQDAAVLGQVVDDATGAPMGGVTISYRHPRRGRIVRYSNGRPTGMRSDASGTFVLPANLVGYELVAIDPDIGCSDWVLLVKGPTNLELRVVAGNVITGVARRGTDGPPVADMSIRFKVVTDRGEHDGPGVSRRPCRDAQVARRAVDPSG